MERVECFLPCQYFLCPHFPHPSSPNFMHIVSWRQAWLASIYLSHWLYTSFGRFNRLVRTRFLAPLNERELGLVGMAGFLLKSWHDSFGGYGLLRKCDMCKLAECFSLVVCCFGCDLVETSNFIYTSLLLALVWSIGQFFCLFCKSMFCVIRDEMARVNWM